MYFGTFWVELYCDYECGELDDGLTCIIWSVVPRPPRLVSDRWALYMVGCARAIY